MSPNFHPVKALLLCLLASQFSSAQVTYNVLDQNNAAATFSNTGTQFVNYGTNTAQYLVPKNGGPSQFHSMQFWYAAKDWNGQLYGSFGGDVANGTDVFPGVNSPGQSGPNIWTVTQQEMDEYHRYWLCLMDPVDSLDCGTVSNPSNDILQIVQSWPHYFPFTDYDMDGNYNPSNGDAPFIKGCRAVYMIQNDAQGPHTYSGAPALGIQMHYLFYQFSQLSYLDEVTFMDVCAINTTTNNYSDFHHGVWFDHEVTSDHSIFGCDSAKQVAYTYYPFNSSGTYATNPPAIGIVDLEGLVTSMQPIESTSSFTTRWDLMNGLKSSGQSWTDPNGNNTAFVFDGNPSDTSSWNQASHPDTLDYSRFLISTNAGSLGPNMGIRGSYALLYTRNGNNLQNVNRLLALTDSVRFFFNGGVYEPCHNGYLGLDDQKLETPVIYPNPTSGLIYISDWNATNASYQLIDVQGKTIQSGSFQKSIDLSDVVKGMYVLVLKTSDGIVQQRVVKE